MLRLWSMINPLLLVLLGNKKDELIFKFRMAKDEALGRWELAVSFQGKEKVAQHPTYSHSIHDVVSCVFPASRFSYSLQISSIPQFRSLTQRIPQKLALLADCSACCCSASSAVVIVYLFHVCARDCWFCCLLIADHLYSQSRFYRCRSLRYLTVKSKDHGHFLLKCVWLSAL